MEIMIIKAVGLIVALIILKLIIPKEENKIEENLEKFSKKLND
jgi:predicted cation transporter